jgi:hypothetical protein
LESAVPTENDAAAGISFEVKDARRAHSLGAIRYASFRFGEAATAHGVIQDATVSNASREPMPSRMAIATLFHADACESRFDRFGPQPNRTDQ